MAGFHHRVADLLLHVPALRESSRGAIAKRNPAMSAVTASKPGHLLLYEPRTEGHHVSWLRFITEDLLSAGVQLTLAVDQRPEHESKIRDHLGDLLSQVSLINARDAAGR